LNYCAHKGGRLQHIAKSKIGTIHSKPNVKYPMIRLPQEYIDLIGQQAYIYKTDYEGEPAFLIVPQVEEDRNPESKSRVSKPSLETTQENRLVALESQISKLESLILQNGIKPDAYKENKRPRARFEPASWPPQS
jgi:hypothetical protein